MSYELNLEISNTMSLNVIWSISNEFESTTITNEIEEKKRFIVHFHDAEMWVMCIVVNDREIYAEHYRDAAWRVGILVTIDDRRVEDYSDALKFIEKIIECSNAAFVLTYQYETTYAARAEGESFFTINEKTPKWLQSSEKAVRG